MEQKYIIVTGGAGYIGSHTIIEIQQNTNFEVISIDNLSNSYADTYQNIYSITNKKVTIIEVDICDKQKLFSALEPYKNNIAGIIHFAAFKSVPESVEQPFKYYHNNIQSLLNIAEFATNQKIKNFIFSSSCSVYGDIKISPVTEETPLSFPSSPYAHTKQMGENILESLVKIANLPLHCLSLRYFNPVGAHQSGLIGELPKQNLTGLAPNLIKNALGLSTSFKVFGNDYNTKDGSGVRDYIHVSDIAYAHVLALKKMLMIKDNAYYDVLNLGTGKGYTVLEIIKTFEKVTRQKINYELAPRRFGDVEAIFANNDKAFKEINWKPKYSAEEMLLSAWNWGKKHYKNNLI